MNFTSTPMFRSLTTIRLFTAIFSLLISIWAHYVNVILNADGILYIYTIDAFKAGGITATESLYNWPFFSILAAWISELSGWSTEFSVKTLNSVLFMLLTDAIVLLSYKSLPNLRQVAIASVLILAFYTLNNYRDFIIRDVGYWAFSCLALYQFVLFLEHQKIKQAVLWQLLMIIALLFRIEAIILLALVPLYVLFANHVKYKRLALFRLYSVSILFTIITGLVAFLNTDIAAAFNKLHEVATYFDPLSILAEIKSGTEILEKEILHPAADEHAGRVLIFGLIITVIWEMLAGISIFYLVLLAMACFFWQELRTCRHQGFYIFIVLINLFILSVFAITSQLITTRYCMLGLLFIFLILLPTITSYISEKIYRKQMKSLAFISFFIIASLADTLIITNNKLHLKTVPTWAAQNLPDNAKFLTNDFRIEYYFNKSRDRGTKIIFSRNPNDITEYNYIIKYIKNDDIVFLNKFNNLELLLVKEQAYDDDRVSIYAVKHK